MTFAHALTIAPDIAPLRVLDMGCGIGTSTGPGAIACPNAEVHGVGVGTSVPRYAHVRAERLGAAVNFSQQNAESTNFSDEHFDIGYSCVVLHEAAMANLLPDSKGLLRPGGIALHLEIPLIYSFGDHWEELSAELAAQFNNEPYWRGALTADYDAMMRSAGFTDVQVGYQSTAFNARSALRIFKNTSDGVFRSWFVTSGCA